MPVKPKRPCNRTGCNTLTTERFCREHQQIYRAEQDKHRGSSTQRGYDARWRKARRYYLKRHPLCVHCLQENVYAPADVVDHITPHRGEHELFWDEDNWQSLCTYHHNVKTAKEDGGFGN
ncbi:HNH endonuclease signature motif containing protein [Alteribacillus sp. YIM 98480]|uniref:HNH endonuclease signature motif containing protein n=1 Tax=Alteribacillus sp. YIM 98480 TaxID=2606599 RepID=UPI00131D57D3|nr:HNH endonuclease signature motif containing protein [Alteribacillus sp. YIM 98480]